MSSANEKVYWGRMATEYYFCAWKPRYSAAYTLTQSSRRLNTVTAGKGEKSHWKKITLRLHYMHNINTISKSCDVYLSRQSKSLFITTLLSADAVLQRFECTDIK